ncbi:MAG: helix-turn-helix transcriptional regulator [Gammaproteobacteria bacterium]
MDTSKSDFSLELSEQDYQSIITFNRRLLECRQRSDLNGLLKSHLLPLLQSQSCVYFFTESDLSQIQIHDAVNIPQEFLTYFPKLVNIDPMGHELLKSHRMVMAYDVDFDRNILHNYRTQFFLDNPEYEHFRKYADSVSTTMAALSLPDANIALVFHRWNSKDAPFTVRQVRIVELLWPSVMQTIRSIFLSEELNRFRSFADSLATVASPIALLNNHWQIVYQNEAYKALFFDYPVNRLPNDLMRLISCQMSHSNLERHMAAPIEIPFYRLNRRTYRIKLATIDVKNNDESLLMLRMDRIVDGYSKLIRRLQENGLTAREVEICLLLKDGIELRNISSRICISYNTIRTHQNNIYKKLNINNQMQLVSYLNSDQENN